MTDEVAIIEGHQVHLAEPAKLPDCKFVGRKNELSVCRAAWRVKKGGRALLKTSAAYPLHFRLQGPPGVGKNEIVYEIARRLQLPLYIIQGHEEMTPEDLALMLVPEGEPSRRDSIGLTLRASPLAHALYKGGLFFFDEINRVPERALSPLSSVLDGRQYIYSALTGLRIEPENPQAKDNFRFCCALNPALSQEGHVLPEYVEQRTLPVVTVGYPSLGDLRKIISQGTGCSPDFIEAFVEWYQKQADKELSVRQVLALISYAMSVKARTNASEPEIIREAAPAFIGPAEGKVR